MGEGLQAFNYFKEEAPSNTLKEFVLARPLVAIDNPAGFVFGINTDFDMTLPIGVPTYPQTGNAVWNTGLWGSGQWGGNPAIQKAWQSVQGMGYCAAMHITSNTSSATIQWNATDYGFRLGGVL